MSRNRVLGLLLAVALLASMSLGLVSAQDKKILITGRQMGSSDIPTLDPSIAEDVPSVQVIDEIFVALARLNEETAEVGPGLSTWTVSEDGLTYTFDILENIPWVRYNAATDAVEQLVGEDGTPLVVTAQDFAYGILRSLNPDTTAPYQYVLSPWIVGGAEYANGEGAMEGVQVAVVDSNTLTITTPAPSAVVPFIFTMWVTMAQPQSIIDEYAEFWIDPENIATYGPFALKEWVRGDGGSLTMVKNPLWPGTENIPQSTIDEVVFRFLDEEVQLTEFEAGTLDIAEAPDTEFARINADANLSGAYFTGPGTCTYYYGFNVEREPFNDVRARRAFSMAIDRETLTTDVLGAGQIPTGIFGLPTLNAAPVVEAFPDVGISTDLEGAAALWGEYLAETGKAAADFNLTLFHNESSLHSTIAQAVQQMWAITLGVNVQIATADFATYLDTRGNYDVYRAAWCFDYPDSHNFYYDAAWHSDLLSENDTHWSSAEYDALVDQAFAAPTIEERQSLYAQAENILSNTEAALAPIYFYVTNDLTAPYVTRTHSFITREYYEKWDINK
jgi:oligopeptide transport system substrate-binding protein